MLEFNERVFLRVSAQANTLFKLIEVIEMFFPGHIDHLKKNHAFELWKHVRTDLIFASLNGLVNDVSNFHFNFLARKFGPRVGFEPPILPEHMHQPFVQGV